MIPRCKGTEDPAEMFYFTTAHCEMTPPHVTHIYLTLISYTLYFRSWLTSKLHCKLIRNEKNKQAKSAFILQQIKPRLFLSRETGNWSSLQQPLVPSVSRVIRTLWKRWNMVTTEQKFPSQQWWNGKAMPNSLQTSERKFCLYLGKGNNNVCLT